MYKTYQTKCSNFLTTTLLIIFIHCCVSAPVNLIENVYSQFIAELNRNKCSVPSQVQLPFDASKVNNFEYLSSYLEICQKTESTKRSKEAVVLCKEIFDNVRNISCPTKIALPDITVNLSENVCKDFGTLKDLIPEDDKSMLKRLTDNLTCDIMCESEFEKACQVLLWSYKVQKVIATVENAQESEQPNVPEDVGDANDKQDNTEDEANLSQINANSENEKKKTEEAENENIGHEKTLESVEPHNLPDNPERKLNLVAIPNKNDENGKPLPNNKETGLEKQTVPLTDNHDLTETSKSRNNFKTSRMQVVQTSNSNMEAKSMEDATKDEFNEQNMNKQPQDEITNILAMKPSQADTGSRISPDFDTNSNTVEQTQNSKTIDSQQVSDKKNFIPSNEHSPYNSEVPNNETPNGKHETGGQNANSVHSSELETVDGKKPGDGDVIFQSNKQNPSILVNENQSITGNAELAKKTDSTSITGGKSVNTVKEVNQQQIVKEVNQQQIVKDVSQQQDDKKVTQQQTIQGTSENELSSTDARDETKANQPQIDSSSKLTETQDNAKKNLVPHDENTVGETGNALTEQKPKIAKQTKDLNITIPDNSKTPVFTDQKLQENGQQSKKITAVNVDVKNAIPSSPIEASTKTTVVLEKMEGDGDLHQPADEETDHYAELQNTEDEDYSRPEYDGGVYDVTKNMEANPDMPRPMTVPKEIITSQNEKPMDFPSRNSYGQEASDIQMIAAFPDQEDGHFFFYFLSVVLILMAGYLIFHNKQKIIALIVEGRHERNRRSHRIGYKKLETK